MIFHDLGVPKTHPKFDLKINAKNCSIWDLLGLQSGSFFYARGAPGWGQTPLPKRERSLIVLGNLEISVVLVGGGGGGPTSRPPKKTA